MISNKPAKKGDKVLFTKKDVSLIGEVLTVNDENIVVQLNHSDANRMKIKSPVTEVSHDNYKLVII
ncbi:DUF2187 family protein [Bacillus sp. CGMCC 1.16607]|uniref:DUF2187 family protein n=1 Tax=Bacillus sp. CGMCC 1.16607 TaxID=3351842 RepID=UPI0036351DCA